MATETISVRLEGRLADYVLGKLGPDGTYESADEFVRDLIRRDLIETQAFAAHDEEVRAAFAQPEGCGVELTADDVIQRNGRRRAA